MSVELAAIESQIAEANNSMHGQTYDGVWAFARHALPAVIRELKLSREGPQPHKSLTKRQAEVLTFVIEYSDEHWYAPTYEEIAAHFGYRALSTVAEHLTNIERKGWISRSYNETRSVTVLHRPVRREAAE